MKAIICRSFGPPSNLEYGIMEDPVPGPKEVLIKIKACSVNFPDTLIIQGLYQFKPPFPFSPGSDVAGVVESVGDDVKGFKVGDEVIGMTTCGGFAEKVAINYKAVFPKPPGMDMIHAASFLMAYGTSYHALLDRAKIQHGETLVVLGASGGVGLTAVELGKLMGAKVIACASTDEKLELCKSYGADQIINYSKENLKEKIKELTNGKGADVIYDPVGGDHAESAIRAMNWNGRYLVIGFAAGRIPKIPLNIPLLKGCQIVGVFWGAFAQKFPGENIKEVMQLIQWFQAGRIKPHIHKVYPLHEGAEALQEIMDRKVKGKIVIEV